MCKKGTSDLQCGKNYVVLQASSSPFSLQRIRQTKKCTFESLCKFDTRRLFFRESCKFFSFSSQHFFFVFVVVFGWKAWNEYNQWKEKKTETLKFMRRFCAQHHSAFDYID